MGKSKGGGGKAKSGGKDGASKNKCTCDHPYQCSCGNRPERPSRGHKWDPESQQWTGKGHKQKGASGQISSVASTAKTTDIGKTKIEQWQSLPTSLLEQFCRKEKRPYPKFKEISSSTNVSNDFENDMKKKQSSYQKRFRYRVIIQDAKATKRGGDHDMIFMPSNLVENEEQAKEEAAMLALLHFTPSLPHERKLPEPYRTTWINATMSRKDCDNLAHGKSYSTETKSNPKTLSKATEAKLDAPLSSSRSSNNSAVASTKLSNANTFASRSEQRRIADEKRKKRNARMQEQENKRMANRDHEVFMSPQIRKQIESLLRADTNYLNDVDICNENEIRQENQIDNMDSDYDDEVAITKYVLEALTRDGFTTSQARAACKANNISLDYTNESNLKDYSEAYESCLQWLCVHLDEDKLPEGFDPRGRTLDVISFKGKNNLGKTEFSKDIVKDPAISMISNKYGITYQEADLIKSICDKDSNNNVRSILWHAYCKAAGKADMVKLNDSGKDDVDKELNFEMASDEIEALMAIFPDEQLDIQRGDITSITIKLDLEDDSKIIKEMSLELTITYVSGLYPSIYPVATITGSWGNHNIKSFFLHIELINFLADLPADEPMIFELFNYLREKIQDLDENLNDEPNHEHSLGLLPFLDGGAEILSREVGQKNKKNKNNTGEKVRMKKDPSHSNTHVEKNDSSIEKTKILRRPRTKSTFWSKMPKNTPSADPFPSLEPLIERARKSLPAAKARPEFLRLMNKADKGGRVILVTGETGCGKTTQIPQFILEEAPSDAKIVVAQPRRLAATGVASRVANERGEQKPGLPGGSVGFVVRGEVAMTESTRLMFCTTGVLLRQLQSEGALDCVTHIVVDEVHERHLDTDVLLGILKESLLSTPHLRVVLMSATMDADRFAAYWGNGTPRMHIPGFTYPVKDYTLSDVLSITGYVPPKKGSSRNNVYGHINQNRADTNGSFPENGDINVTSNYQNEDNSITLNATDVPPIEELVRRVNQSEINYELLGILVKHLVDEKESKNEDGSILIFLSGAPEISRAEDAVRRITKCKGVMLLPLHGGLQSQEQQRVFHKARFGLTKVILSTNVAETSITIPDCTVVIDSCREKQSSYDPLNRMPMLIERFASRDSLQQRRGRAGRVRSGSCYKLISTDTLNRLPQHGEPEIKRCALDQMLLSLLFIGVEDGSGKFLSTLLDPPNTQAVRAAITSLEKLGALVRREENSFAASLSALGMHLAGIPAPPAVGKILVMGSMLGCRTAGLAMGSGMSIGRSPFLKINVFRGKGASNEVSEEESKEKQRMENRKNLFKIVGNSDHALLAIAYMQWNAIKGGSGEKKRYCDSLGLSINGMRDMKQLVNQLDTALTQIGFCATSDSEANCNSWRIIRCCAVSALAPIQLVRVMRPTTKFTETVEGSLEKKGVAKELQFFIRGDQNAEDEKKSDFKSNNLYNEVQEERVFFHPSSANFSVGSYTCPWLVYHQLVRTSKPFLRDATECSSYALLLFGGKIEVQASNGLIIVDDYARLSANARIGALLGGLKRKLDSALSLKVADPSLDIAKRMEMKLIVKLLMTDGLG